MFYRSPVRLCSTFLFLLHCFYTSYITCFIFGPRYASTGAPLTGLDVTVNFTNQSINRNKREGLALLQHCICIYMYCLVQYTPAERQPRRESHTKFHGSHDRSAAKNVVGSSIWGAWPNPGNSTRVLLAPIAA
jgi:hypothetical protein